MKFKPTTNHEQSRIDWYPNNPVTVYKFTVTDDNHLIVNNHIQLQEHVKNLHLEIIGNDDLSLLIVEEIVNLFETQTDDFEIEWNVTLSSSVMPQKILVCCVV